MNNWAVTYCVITADSAENGDVAESGCVAESVSFRDALAYWTSRTGLCDLSGIEADSWPVTAPRWFTKTFEEFDTGDTYQATLHIPQNVTAASRRRLACLLGVSP